ncbi:MAG: hypothetical protein R3D28_20650 [Geminicoccaceae bacterium]
MHHKPILFLAFKRNYLSRFTRLAHEWFFDKNDKLHLIVPQYKKDLIEKWMLEGDYKNRFKNGRIYKSRWAELFFAKWLLDHSWKIVELEATGGQSDVIALSKDRIMTTFEVKNIGMSPYDFDVITEMLQSPIGVSIDAYDDDSYADYLIYRIYQGAKQIRNRPGKKVVVVILEDYQFHYKNILKENRIKWNSPKFFNKTEDMQELLRYEYEKSPNFDESLVETIKSVHEIWIFEMNYYYLHLRHILPTGS